MMDQISLIAAVLREVHRQGVKSLVPRQTNVIIACVNEIIREIENEPIEAKSGIVLGTSVEWPIYR